MPTSGCKADKGGCMSEKSNSLGKGSAMLNLMDTIAGDERFSALSMMMISSGANEVFGNPGEFTVLAPTNAAFAKIPTARMTELRNQENQVDLKELLSYHILPGKLVAAKLANLRNSRTITEGRVAISDNDGLKINGSAIETRNIEASNGVIHAIDTVLAPPIAVAAVSSDKRRVASHCHATTRRK